MTIGEFHDFSLNIALFDEEMPVDLIVELLQKAVTEKSKEDFHIEPYNVEKLFKALDKSADLKEEIIARLEWLYLPILARASSKRLPKMLHKELSNNPELFSEVIKNLPATILTSAATIKPATTSCRSRILVSAIQTRNEKIKTNNRLRCCVVILPPYHRLDIRGFIHDHRDNRIQCNFSDTWNDQNTGDNTQYRQDNHR